MINPNAEPDLTFLAQVSSKLCNFIIFFRYTVQNILFMFILGIKLLLWGGRWEGGSCLGTHVRIKDFKIKKKIKN